MEAAMTVMWTPEHALFLAGIAMAIAFLLGGEMLEAWRSRRRTAVAEKIARKPRQATPPVPTPSETETALKQREIWRTSRLGLSAVALRRMGLD
jgi:phosphoglycolate phosphatase-like HAD superfamily hydrolase